MGKKKGKKKQEAGGGEGAKKNGKALAKEQKRTRQEQKANHKKMKERKKKEALHDRGEDEEDIEEMLKRLDQEVEAVKAVVTSVLPAPPPPRSHASFTVLPNKDILMFGGEKYDGQKVQVFGDLHRWNVEKNEWRQIVSPVMPKARCSHQAVVYNDCVYVFGGEFSTFYQFFHFKDLWKFSLKTNLWSKVEVGNVNEIPHARSGHRLAVWRNLLVLFGGFHDTTRETRYFNDLYLYFFNENKWRRIEYPPHAAVPCARSGCLFHTYPPGDFIFMHGGFAKVKDTAKKVQGKTYTDTWILNLKPLTKDARKDVPVWEKIRNTGSVPCMRTGMSGAVYKNSVIVFGGVADVDDGQVKIKSTFFNDLHSFDLERKRWYALTLKGQESREKQQRQKRSSQQAFGRTEEVEVSDSERESPKRRAGQVEGEGGSDEEMLAGGGGDDDDDDEYQHTFAYFDEKGRLVRICVNDHEKGRDSATSPVPAGTPSPEGCTESPSALDKAPRKTRGACDGSPGPPLSAPPDPAPSASALPLSPRSTTSSSRSSSCSSSSSSSSSCAGTGSGSKSGGQQVYRGDAPLPRLHGHLVVRGSSLLLYGGLIELDDKEVTLDDCWTLNLSKRDRWHRVLEGTMHQQEWLGEDEAEEEEEEEEEEEGSEEECESGGTASSSSDADESSSDEACSTSTTESSGSDDENEEQQEEEAGDQSEDALVKKKVEETPSLEGSDRQTQNMKTRLDLPRKGETSDGSKALPSPPCSGFLRTRKQESSLSSCSNDAVNSVKREDCLLDTNELLSDSKFHNGDGHATSSTGVCLSMEEDEEEAPALRREPSRDIALGGSPLHGESAAFSSAKSTKRDCSSAQGGPTQTPAKTFTAGPPSSAKAESGREREHEEKNSENSPGGRRGCDVAGPGRDQENGGNAEVKKKKKKKQKEEKQKEKSFKEEVEELRETYRLHDQDETPAEGETLRLFFERTKQHWIHLVVTSSQTGTGSLQGDDGREDSCLRRELLLRDDKELKRAAFQMASDRYEELLPCLKRLEELKQREEDCEDGEGSMSGRRKHGDAGGRGGGGGGSAQRFLR